MKKFKIDFMGIGVPKAGTTTIAKILSEHPEISFYPGKEINYFSEYNRFTENKNNIYEKEGLEGYKKLFFDRNINFSKKVGEFSVHYIHDKKAAERIKKHFSDIKLIIMLRNPIERSFSIYNMEKYFYNSFNSNFFDSVKKYPQIIEESKYFWQLKMYFDLFPKENIKIIFLEEFEKKPEIIVKELFDFLGVDSSYKPFSLGRIENSSKTVKFKSLSIFTRKIIPKTSMFLKKINLNFILVFFKKIGVDSLILKIERKWNTKSNNSKISQKEYDFLYNLLYEDILKTEDFLKKKGYDKNLKSLWSI